MLTNGALNSQHNSTIKAECNANFVSSLQKASSSFDRNKHRWLEQCYEVVISPKSQDPGLILPIDGGSDAGMFCVVGAQFDTNQISYDSVTTSSSSIKPGDIILSMNGYEVSGYTKRDAVMLWDALINSSSLDKTPLRLRLSPPHSLATGNTMLSSFLTASFSTDSPEYALQERIRENVYQRVVPCTTRLPRADEIDGVHYRFMNVQQFLNLELNGQLLESGMYKGNHYGTPRPDPNSSALNPYILEQLKSDKLMNSQISDDTSLQIPPPLPPLTSLATIGINVPGKLTDYPSSTIPPTPPVRNSSINKMIGNNNNNISNTTTTEASGADISNNNGNLTLAVNSVQQCTNSVTTLAVNTTSTVNTMATMDSTTTHLSTGTSNQNDWTISKDEAIYVNKLISPGTPKFNGDAMTNGAPFNVCTDEFNALPYGWEVVQDPKYGTFYIDHINKHTQYEPPNESDFQLAEKVRLQMITRNDSSASHMGNSTIPLHSHYPESNNADESNDVPLNNGLNNGRITPVTVTTDPSQLRGPLVTTTLVKSPRGFGFTIIGGSDCNRVAFLQVKHLVPGGPASLNSRLSIGDVIVSVNNRNVLGYTHAQLVSLFQAIPIGASVNILVSQGYNLRHDVDELLSEKKITPANHLCFTDPTTQLSPRDVNLTSDRNSHPTNSSRTASPHSSLSPTLSSTTSHPSLEQPASRSPQIGQYKLANIRKSQRPEFIKVSIFKRSNGFGFTLADHLQGQHVKAISDPKRCGRLCVGDVVVEINDQRVKEMSHNEVVKILKECPVDQEARLLVQRGGLYTSPLSLLDPDDTSFNALNLNDQNYPDDVINLDCDFHVNTAVNQSTKMDNPRTTMYATPQPQRNNLYARNNSHRFAGNFGSSDSIRTARSQTPDPSIGRNVCYNPDITDLNNRESWMMRQKSLQSYPHPFTTIVSDRRQRVHPSDDSIVGLNKDILTPGSPTSTTYGSLLRPGRMPPLRQFAPRDCLRVNPAASTSLCMLPGEFLVHLKRQSTGFGFNLVGGAEESTQVSIGALFPGGSAQLSGVVRTGDHVISVDGIRVIGATHAEVVKLLDRAAHTAGQVTLGLQRQRIETQPCCPANREPIDVVIPRMDKSEEGFGFLVSPSNSDPKSNEVKMNRPSGEFVSHLIPGSHTERMGLLCKGDQILAINGIPIEGLSHNDMIRLLRDSGNQVALRIRPVDGFMGGNHIQMPVARNWIDFPVILFRGSRGFGFSIRGGQEFNRMPLIVLRIAAGGAAQMDGRLRVGDELIEINGYSTIGMSHGQAIEIIQSGGNTMRLVVRRYHRSKTVNGTTTANQLLDGRKIAGSKIEKATNRRSLDKQTLGNVNNLFIRSASTRDPAFFHMCNQLRGTEPLRWTTRK